MTPRIYRLVVVSMAVIAVLAVVRSFAGGNEVAGQRLGWGALAFTYPGMWDLLGITGSVLWVSTRPGLSPRRWGIGITLVAVAVVAFSVGSEAYVLARDVLPAGWPEAAFIASAAVPVVYAVLTHVAAVCRVALDAPSEEEPSTPSRHAATPTAPSADDSDAPRSVSAGSSAPSSTAAPLPPTSPTIPATTDRPGPVSSLSGPPTTTATAASTGSSTPGGPTSEGGSTPPSPSDDGRPESSPTAASPEDSPAPAPSGPTSSAPASSPPPPSSSGSELETADTDELEAQFAEPSAPSGGSPSSAPSVPSSPFEEPLDEHDPNRYPDPDGTATREARRRWALAQMRQGIDVQGGDVEKRFGLPRSGAAVVREARQRFDDERVPSGAR